MTFVLASNNSGKLREFAPLFESMGLEVVAQRDFAVSVSYTHLRAHET